MAKQAKKDKSDEIRGRESFFYPIFVQVGNAKCVVVGGGKVAERKVKNLIAYDAKVVVISPEITAGISELVKRGLILHKRRHYRTSDIKGAFIVFAATSDRAINGRISREAREAGILVNVVDDPELCNFIVPAIARSGGLQIAVSTGGKSPSLARRIRKEVAKLLDPAYSGYLDFVGELRREICEKKSLSKGERMEKLRLLADERLFRVFKRRGKRAARKEAKKLMGV